MGKIHEEAKVVTDLQRKGIHITNGTIEVPSTVQCGNKTLGKLDFLLKHKGYVVKIQTFEGSQKDKKYKKKKYQKEELTKKKFNSKKNRRHE